MKINLMRRDDASVNSQQKPASFSRWREYVDTYILRLSTEWVPQIKEIGPVFLKR